MDGVSQYHHTRKGPVSLHELPSRVYKVELSDGEIQTAAPTSQRHWGESARRIECRCDERSGGGVYDARLRGRDDRRDRVAW